MKDVELRVDKKSLGTFVVGGVDISNHVTRVSVYIVPGRSTEVVFEVVGDVALDAEQADVTVERRA